MMHQMHYNVLIADNEYLIGFIYLRILEVSTTKIEYESMQIVNRNSNINKVESNTASYVRSAFFAVHLFKEQIFSMSDHLETMMEAFLHCIFGDCEKMNNEEFISSCNSKTAWICQNVLSR